MCIIELGGKQDEASSDFYDSRFYDIDTFVAPIGCSCRAGNIGVCAEDITATTATITWATNDSCIGTVYYDTTNTTPLDNHESEAVAVTDHLIQLEDLAPDTVHYYYVVCGGERFPVDEDEYRFSKTLSSPGGYYRITLDHACGVCGEIVETGVCVEVIGVTAVVAVEGDYHICWDSLSSAAVVHGGTFSAAGPGTYELTFLMPETAGGIHNVYLTNNAYNDLGEDAVAEFVVSPSAKIDPEEGPVGTEVILNGYGFNEDEEIRVEFNDTVVSSDTAPTANDNGSWEFSYIIPDSPGGGYTFDVGPQSNPDVILLSKYFKVIPLTTIEPEEGPVNTIVTLSGYGFGVSQDIRVALLQDDVQEGSTQTSVASDLGSWTVLYTIPDTPAGLYTFEIEAREGTVWVHCFTKYFAVTSGPTPEWCFIATAAYGTPMAEEVQILREFRDDYLLTNPLGQALTNLYYKLSPLIAEFITDHQSLKPMVRAGLLPAIVMSTVMVNTTPAEKATTLGILVVVTVAMVIWMVRRRDSRHSPDST